MTTQTLILIGLFVVVAALLLGAVLAIRFSNRATLSTPEQEAGAALEKGLSFLLDDGPDDKAIAAATKRKAARAATRNQVLHEIASAVAASGQTTQVQALKSLAVPGASTSPEAGPAAAS